MLIFGANYDSVSSTPLEVEFAMTLMPILPRLALAALLLITAACATTRSGGQAGTDAPPDPATTSNLGTYDKKSVIDAAEGVFGRGTEGLGDVVETIFKDMGRPNAYIAGREIGGAFVVGVRYGDGTLYHKIEGEEKIHWTGPSVGFDLGGDASKSFVLVYHLDDMQSIYKRFPAIEGKVYFVLGFSVNYHQYGNVILVPVRLGAGWRLAANIGYLHYTKDRTYLPF
jgi:hypothetical protein